MAQQTPQMTRSEAKRLILAGGLALNGQKELDPFRVLTSADFPNGEALLTIGKKKHFRVILGEEVKEE